MTILRVIFELDAKCPECGETFDPLKYGVYVDLWGLLRLTTNLPTVECPQCSHDFIPDDIEIHSL